MVKRYILLCVALCMSMLIFGGCGGFFEKTLVQHNEKQVLTASEFEALLAEQPMVVTKTKILVQSEEYKLLYPDLMQAFVTNRSALEIKNLVVAFAAWDENQLPVKIKKQMDFSEGSYIVNMSCNDVNLVGGGSFGREEGLPLADDHHIDICKAIVVSYETFDGSKWENPYYDAFRELYAGKKLSEARSVAVEPVDESFPTAPMNGENGQHTNVIPSSLSAEELEEYLHEQPLFITETEYVVQGENKGFYPDLLQVIFRNNSTEDIKNVVVVFAAWDKNNLPIKLKGPFDLTEGDYLRKMQYSDINLIPGDSYGEDSGLALGTDFEVATFKAIVLSYETFDGKKWENPCYDAFCELYEGVKLA